MNTSSNPQKRDIYRAVKYNMANPDWSSDDENLAIERKLKRYISPYNKQIHYHRGMKFTNRYKDREGKPTTAWQNLGQLILSDDWISFTKAVKQIRNRYNMFNWKPMRSRKSSGQLFTRPRKASTKLIKVVKNKIPTNSTFKNSGKDSKNSEVSYSNFTFKNWISFDRRLRQGNQ